MKRYFILIVFFLLILNSCKEKPTVITKLIYIRVNGLVYDSLKKPHFWIYPYFEYQKDNRFKAANGKGFRLDSIAPLNGLNNFFELDADKKTIELINKTLLNKNFDSTYSKNFEPRFSYFLIETSDNNKRVITFARRNDYPHELYSLSNHIDSLISNTSLRPVEPFIIDSMFINLENNIFIKYPPPAYPFDKRE